MHNYTTIKFITYLLFCYNSEKIKSSINKYVNNLIRILYNYIFSFYILIFNKCILYNIPTINK